MIHFFTSPGRAVGRSAELHRALVERLHAGEAVVVSSSAGTDRLELDGFGGIRRVPLTKRTNPAGRT